MKTFLNLKTFRRYPERGCASAFSLKSNGKVEHHIKPGYPECTNGWKKVNSKIWREEEIPDLAKPFTRAQWIDYATKYGVPCAQEFLDTCNYMKPTAAFQMFNPPKNEQKWIDNAEWFKKTFKRSIWDYTDGVSMAYGNTYSIDILRFEKHLASEFEYPLYSYGSMSDFMKDKFGEETTMKFKSVFFEK